MVRDFGVTEDGQKAKIYLLENKNGMQISVSDYGATIVQVIVPDRNGEKVDVVLGYSDVMGYEAGGVFFGAPVGRIANRIGNAEFKLNGVSYPLAANDSKNNLHSGPDFYSKRMWNVDLADEAKIEFSLYSPDGDQGYPGAAAIKISYMLTEDNELNIHYYAKPEKDTIINMTNHSYFNLSGHSSGTILDQSVWLDAEEFTRADEEAIPTGEILNVSGTPMDFTTLKTVGRDIDADYEALRFGGGYDHNYVLSGNGYRKVGEMHSAKTGIGMDIYTDLPGMQLYSGNFIIEEAGKDGAVYRKRSGICFETQYFPDAVHQESFKGPVVRKGEIYESTTAYRFYSR